MMLLTDEIVIIFYSYTGISSRLEALAHPTHMLSPREVGVKIQVLHFRRELTMNFVYFLCN